ncbi:hypothetical protein [Streptomyces inhibens]|uniref:hypothetical protein n=1 Tax=Streptomyces inhibens TaxID=2293571 RepID=UPI001EE70271|nr:hypothetical protein [Streptomyces inhibens]UKY50352.1 hypothetical protein KI385_17005 [Streptomyces inhibens]
MTAIDGSTPASTTHDTERPVPRWAEIVAHLIPLVALPVCLWRLPIGFGYGMGGAVLPPAWFNAPYVVGLSVLSESFALLTFGLVRRWGEVVPDWIPKVGGKRIPPFAVIAPGALAGLAFLALMVHWAFGAFRIGGASGFPYADGWDTLAITVSGLFTLWGPLLLVLTYAYYRRRCQSDIP